MTIKQIEALAKEQEIIHRAAVEIVELMQAAVDAVGKLGGDGEAARERILELVND